MIQQLSIRNYALIRELEFTPAQGLNIITGETGAGKSIMLGALGLLLGQRADSKVLFNDTEKCVIEGQFNIALYALKSLFDELDLDFEELCIIRREIAPGGKSRAFINDSPVTLDVLKAVGSRLMDIHSQHETLLLGMHDFQLSVIDAYAGLSEQATQYGLQYKAWRKASEEFESKKKVVEDAARLLDYNVYLLTELAEVDPQSGEQERLEQELKKLENAGDVGEKLHLVAEVLVDAEQSAVSLIKHAEKNLSFLSKYTSEYEPLLERLRAVLLEVKDIGEEISSLSEQVEVSPAELASISDRLSRLYSLQKKHGVPHNEELIKIRVQLEQEVGSVRTADEELAKYAQEVDNHYKSLVLMAAKLSKQRMAAAPLLSEELNKLLKEVGIPNAQVLVDCKATEIPTAGGWDKINFLFSANKGMSPQELKQVASGGEFSRLMLCLKYILAARTAMPTIVFDEIDAGISGEVAIRVGKIMKKMASGHQLIVISHLPQIAASGDEHYYVYKDHSSERTVSNIKRLKTEERIQEIAQMIGGEKPSATALKSAKEMLAAG